MKQTKSFPKPLATVCFWWSSKRLFCFLFLSIIFYGCTIKSLPYQMYEVRPVSSRAASAENPTAEKGSGGKEKDGFKGSPAIKDLKRGATAVLLDKEGPGIIRHIWCTVKPNQPNDIRNIIVRMYWENNSVPSVEVPLSDFFGLAHGAKVLMNSRLITVQPQLGYNCYIPMPFRNHALVTITNESDSDLDWFFYQIDFTLGDKIPKTAGRFHACFYRENPTKPGKDFTILETDGAKGVYLGCILGIRPLSEGWCGEGEVKIFIDDDGKYPTICGTGTEDYVGAAWGLQAHSTFSQGAPLVEPDYLSIYRFHIDDPVFFQKKILIAIQQMGLSTKDKVIKKYGTDALYRSMEHPRRSPNQVYYMRSDDVCATAYWYQYPLIRERRPLPGKSLRSDNLYKRSKDVKAE